MEEKSEEETKEDAEKAQIKSEKKTLRNFLIIIVMIAVAFLATFLLINSTKHFNYKGVDFFIDKNEVKGMTFYQTSLPVGYPATGQVVANYRFFLRNDPRELESMVPINGNLVFRKNMVLDSSANDFFCSGYGLVAVTELSSYMSKFNINISAKKNDSSKYIPANDYMFLVFSKGNSTEIRQLHANVYELVINNCEILPAMERIILERLVMHKETGI